MSQGLPVISTNSLFGPSEVLDNGKYGIFVPIGDEKKMANAILRLLTSKKKREYYARKSLERVRFFSEEKMLRKYIELIKDLLKDEVKSVFF